MKKFNEFITEGFGAIRSFTPDVIMTPIMVQKERYGNMETVKGSIYNEDNELVEADFVLFEDLDMEGRYKNGKSSIAKVETKYFTAEEHETHDKSKTWFKYKLTSEGYDHYKSGLKGFGGYPVISFMTKKELEDQIKREEGQVERFMAGIQFKKNLL